MDYMKDIKNYVPDEAWIVASSSKKLTKSFADRFYLIKEDAEYIAQHLNKIDNIKCWKARRVLIFVLE